MICPNANCNRSDTEGLDLCNYCGTPLNPPAVSKRKTEAEMPPSPGGVKRKTVVDSGDIFDPDIFKAHGAESTKLPGGVVARPAKRTVYGNAIDNGSNIASPVAPAQEPGRYAGRRIVGWLITFDGNTDGISHTLYEGRMTIGKDRERSDIVVSDQKVSENHAVITLRTTARSIVDYQSLNGTYVNDLDINVLTPKELKNGDVIRIGETRFICNLLDLEKVEKIWKP